MSFLSPEISNYLEEVRSHLHLAVATERQLIGELNAHFQEKLTELKEQGISDSEAIRIAIESFGRAKTVAQLLYEACSKGSWADALRISLPHIIVATLFIGHLLYNPATALTVFVFIVLVTLFGWWRGKPGWLYSWVGYALMPLLVGGFAFWPVINQAFTALIGNGVMPSTWMLVVAIAFYGLTLWLIVRITIHAVRRDWLLASLMLVPLPIVGCWLFSIEQAGGIFGGAALYHWDGSMALALGVLGITSIVFIRLRQRVLKGGAIVTVGAISMMMVGQSLWGDIGFFGLMALSIFMLIVLFAPAFIETVIGRGLTECPPVGQKAVIRANFCGAQRALLRLCRL